MRQNALHKTDHGITENTVGTTNISIREEVASETLLTKYIGS